MLLFGGSEPHATSNKIAVPIELHSAVRGKYLPEIPLLMATEAMLVSSRGKHLLEIPITIDNCGFPLLVLYIANCWQHLKKLWKRWSVKSISLETVVHALDLLRLSLARQPLAGKRRVWSGCAIYSSCGSGIKLLCNAYTAWSDNNGMYVQAVHN